MGRFRHIGTGRESEAEERWGGISLGYGYLEITGTYMRRKWIAPFDFYASSMCRNKQQAKSRNPEDSDKIAIMLVREAVGNG